MSESSTPRALPDGALEGVTLSCGYTVGEKLGKGGMAWVYEATKDDQRMALKILFSHMADDEEFNARFLREARIQQALDHPSIVGVTDIIEERGLVGFALEYCNEGTLLDLLKELRGPMPFWQIKSLFLPLIDAMGYAHEQGVIHRDLKPPNILLHRENDVLIPKLTDFGIAKLFGDATLTQTGTMIGTLLYMSPEQVEESKYVDARADIYSLGILLYQLASGTLPFIGKSSALMMQILNDPAPRPKTMEPLADVIMRCLAKDPAERYQSCKELSAAVSTALDSCMDAQHPEAVGPLPTGEPDTMSMQGSAGARPGGADTIEDLDAIATAQTQMLTPGDMASERSEGSVDEEETPSTNQDAEGVADDTASEALPFGLQATVDAAAFVPEAVAEVVSLTAESESKTPEAPVAPSETEAQAPPLVPLTIVEPDAKGLSDQGKQSLLLGFVALGLALIVAVLWMGRTQQTRPALPPRAQPTQPQALRPVVPKRPTKRRQVPKPLPRKPLAFRMTRRPATPPGAIPAVGLDSSVAAQKQRCESGDAPSCRHWAKKLMATGIIAKQEKALKTMGHACDLRDLQACVILGHWYKQNLLKQPAAPEKSIKVWMRACQLGARAVCFRLGQVWHRRQRLKLACRLYRKSCRKEHAEGCLWQGWCALDKAQRKRRSKRLRKRYLRVARRLFKVACDLRSGAGCNRYALFFSERTFGSVDESIARRYFGRACKQGSYFGCFNAGLFAMSGRGGLPQPDKARGFFKQACTLGDARACYLLGTILHRTSPKKASRRAALPYFQAACRYKLAQGCYHVAYLLSREASLARICTVAGSWLKRACSSGLRPCPRCKPRRRLAKPPAMKAPALRWRSLSQLIEDHAP